MNMIRIAVAAAVAIACTVQGSAQSAVTIRFEDGRVTLSARNALLRTILAEWARVGGSRIVNGEQIAGQPLTLELTNVPEREALGILLRTVSGYIAAPRVEQGADRSSFDRIFVLPASAATRQAASAAATAPGTNPVFFVTGAPGEGAQLVGIVPRVGASATAQRVPQQLDNPVERVAGLSDQADAVEGGDDAPASSAGQSPDAPGRPFGAILGSARPGEIAPVPQEGPSGVVRLPADPER